MRLYVCHPSLSCTPGHAIILVVILIPGNSAASPPNIPPLNPLVLAALGSVVEARRFFWEERRGAMEECRGLGENKGKGKESRRQGKRKREAKGQGKGQGGEGKGEGTREKG